MTRVLTMIHNELHATMGLTGSNSIAGIGRDNLVLGTARDRLQEGA